jgi:2-polyprenyl-3-methyl-5-hydroxy-6-metoxy-1,4-benzoquinol methylase
MKELNKIAKSYPVLQDKWNNLKTMIRAKEYSTFSKEINSYENVLEIGLGDGSFLKLLAKDFDKVYALDGSSVIIDKLKKNIIEFKNIEYHCSYIEDFSIDKKFKNIVMGHILEHIEKPIDALRKTIDLLEDDGIIYISVPNANSIHRQVAVEMGLLESKESLNKSDITLGHYRVYTPKLFEDDIKASGIKVIAKGGIMLKPLSNTQITDSFTKEMIQGFISIGDKYPELCGDIYIIGKKAI